MQLRMSPSEIEHTIASAFGSSEASFRIEQLQPGSLRMRTPFDPSMLRPGGTISGPTLFNAADLAMYALVLGHIGPQLMAVTAQLNINFLKRGKAGDVVADAKLLKLGRMLAVIEVHLYCGDEPEMAAQVTGSYRLPRVTFGSDNT